MKVDFHKKIRSLDDLTDDEKSLIAVVLLLPSFVATLFFLFSPFFS